jgi:uncharacterized membrane protein YjfL (UPF0719 family)
VAQIAESAIIAVELLVVLFSGTLLFVWLSELQGIRVHHEVTANDNTAVGVRYALFVLAMIIAFSQVIYRVGSIKNSLLLVLIYGVMIIANLIASYYFNSFLMLHTINNHNEVVVKKNVAVAVVEGSTFLAMSFIISSTLLGFTNDFLESFLWLGIGELLLVILTYVFHLFVPGMYEALKDRNLACAFSLGGLLAALGYAVAIAVSGPSTTLGNDLRHVGEFLFGWAVFMFIAHFAADRVLVPTVRLRAEVMDRANVAVGLMEGVVFVGFTLLYSYVIR